MGMYTDDSRCDIDCSKGGPSLTKQQFAEETDINKIVAKYERTGMINRLNTKQAFYADVSEYGDYRDCLEKVQEAESAFAALDAEMRGKFENDPAKLIDFLMDPKNADEAVRLGLVVPPKKEEVKTEEPVKA